MSPTKSVVPPKAKTAWPLPQIVASRLPDFSLDDWPRVLAAFQAAPVCPMDQGWQPQPDPELRPGTVRVGWRPEALLVLAELHDDDIFNPVEEFNAPAFQQGDVFEMFLRPESQDTYYELHISPINQHFQLRIPSMAAFRELGSSAASRIKQWQVHERVIDSRTQVLPAERLWRVVARIPFAAVMENEPFQPGCRWKFSFSRYDYTRGQPKPVLSSTSPHVQCGYHRQEEWGTMVFEAK